MNILDKIITKLELPLAILILQFKNFVSWTKNFFHKNKKTTFNEYSHRNFVLLVLFEKGKIRDDILNLMHVLKKNDCFISVVNSKKIDPSYINDHKQYIDSYIERFNYGRDFGSYKCGMLDFYQNYNEININKFLILNDSIFYAKKNLERFIEQMLNTNQEVLGITENHDIEYHLGSFFLSLEEKIVNDKNIRSYWKNYKLTDYRKQVVKLGEMGFNKALKKSVTKDDGISALYNTNKFINFLDNNESYVDNFTEYTLQECKVEKTLMTPQTMFKAVSSGIFSTNMFTEDEKIQSKIQEIFFSNSLSSFIQKLIYTNILKEEDKDKAKLRHLLKAITWRLIASVTTTLIAFYFGLPAKAIGLVFFADLIIKFILYYVHERLWFNFGTIGKKKDDQ